MALAAAILVGASLLLLIGVQVWSWATSRELLTLERDDGFYSVAFGPDGKRRAATAIRIGPGPAVADPAARAEHPRPLVTVWEATSGQRLYTIENADASAAFCAVFSPDGKWLAVRALAFWAAGRVCANTHQVAPGRKAALPWRETSAWSGAIRSVPGRFEPSVDVT